MTRSNTKRKRASAPIVGRIEPRLVTPLAGGMETRGADVAEWAGEHLGVRLMDWQRAAFDGLLALRDPLTLQHRRGLISTARQNGKSVMSKALIGWWLTEGAAWRGEPQSIIHVADKLELVTEVFDALAPILRDRFDAKVKWSYGRQSCELANGSRWKVLAAREASGHGHSADLIVLDELWNIKPSVVEVGLAYTQRARRSSLMAAWSTAGDEDSALMLQWREAALQAIDAGKPGTLYYAEWSPPPGSDPELLETWAWANPALGTTITAETWADEVNGKDRNAFLRSSLNLWVAAAASWLPAGAWEACRYAGDWTTDEGGVLAVDCSVNGNRWVGVRAWPTGQVETAFVVDTEPECWTAIASLLDADATIQLAYAPPFEVHLPERYQGRAVKVGQQEVVAYTVTVRNAILDGRLLHRGETQLSEHVERAVAVYTANTLGLASKRSPGPIELARCLVWAWTLATRPVTRRLAAAAFG